ncbi:MAG TPA: NAD(P)H-dependent glycerol-3-phosphate dehydrogenase, partial [Tepidiformaceae bacterium]|nr:NAD(P)H-dependent glycerol-3-phosphate dehydrogenase [Tepidiformaceae bacterium]
LEHAGHAVTVVVRTEDEARAVRAAGGVERLPEVRFSSTVHIATSITAGEVDGLILAVPAQAVRGTVEAAGFSRDLPLLSATKGIEHGTRLPMSGVLGSMGWSESLVAVLSGPNLAHEVARGLPAAAVVAAADGAQAVRWQRAFNRPGFRVYTSTDVPGVELAGALKNVVAIAAGAAVGLGMGANTVAAVMTRGLAEITRLGVAMGADPLTFQGLAGIGDLSVTCFSPLSRNRRFGELLAQGRTVSDALAAIGEVAEGASTAPVAVEMARRAGVEMPIAEQVAAVVEGHLSVRDAMAGLLEREPRPERDPAL